MDPTPCCQSIDDPVPPPALADATDEGDCSDAAVCDALRQLQGPEDPRGAVWLRAQQCLGVLEGTAGARGEGMPLWGK
jgi:hypothetical protein